MPPGAPAGFVSNIDRGMQVELAMSNNVTASIHADLGIPHTLGVIPQMPKVLARIECERGSVELLNFVGPMLFHTISVTRIDDHGKKTTRSEKAYVFASDSDVRQKGQEWWSTYRYQLESFVDKLKGRTPQNWITKEDSIANIEWIEKIYAKVSDIRSGYQRIQANLFQSGLGSRPQSKYVHSSS